MSGTAPLTCAERSVWFASMLSANPLSYNAACILAIEGALSTQRLVDAFGGAIAGAGLSSLRVVADKHNLMWRKDERAAPPPIYVCEDFQSDPLIQLSEIFFASPISADSAPLIAVHILKDRPRRHFVMLRHHHVLLDFQGATTLLNLVAAIYNGDDPPIADDRRAEIAAAEREYLTSDLYRADERYWRERMAGLRPAALSKPAPMPSSAVRIDLAISAQAFAAFASAARAIGSTPFQSVLMIAYAYLEREQQGDVIFGVPLASREAGILNSQSRMVPFRVNLRSALSHEDAATAIRLTLRADLERARFPIWENTGSIFPGERRGALPRVALNFMRATPLRFGAAAGAIARVLYGEPNAETYIRCVAEADGRLSVSLDSVRDRDWVEGFGQALAAGIEGLAGCGAPHSVASSTQDCVFVRQNSGSRR